MDALERERFSRQILLPQIGEFGQRKLRRSKVVVVGCGALGTVHATLLTRAGVGELVLIDRDYVEESNLQRQWLFEPADVEQVLPKAVAAAERLATPASPTRLTSRVCDLTAVNAESLLTPADVILDGTDNFAARYLINDVAVKTNTPWIYAAAVGTEGSLMPIVPGRTACLSCIFPAAPKHRQPTCDTAGVLNTVTALIAALQATEALKILVGQTRSLRRRLVSTNIWTGESSSIRADQPDPECPTCGARNFRYLHDEERDSATLCGRDAVQIAACGREVNMAELANALRSLGRVRSNPYALRFVCPPHELTVFPDGRAIVKGTQDTALARSLYARYVGH